jgi:8-oxo-dGTP pyrophosphatase MutT (NUDIX family)
MEPMTDQEQWILRLQDDMWPFHGIDHVRHIARAVLMDDEGFFYFVKTERNDEFGACTNIETPGGGIEAGERERDALRRELMEELGVQANILCRIGTVIDQYNLLRRKNISSYYLCRAESFGSRRLTDRERRSLQMEPLKLTYKKALQMYEMCACSPLGKLISAREVPVLERAKALLDTLQNQE